MTLQVPKDQLEFLRSIDTPTVCNLIEVVEPERRGHGYTTSHLHCPFPDLPPMVGFAKTVTMRAQDRVALGEAGYMNKRLDYLDYVASAPQPGIAVIQDLDEAFRVVFKQGLAEERDPESGEALVSAQADAPEPLPGNLLDVGEIVAEQLSLAADPYPRKHGVKLEDVLPKPRKDGRHGRHEPRRHPFAGLAALRDKPRRDR